MLAAILLHLAASPLAAAAAPPFACDPATDILFSARAELPEGARRAIGGMT